MLDDESPRKWPTANDLRWPVEVGHDHVRLAWNGPHRRFGPRPNGTAQRIYPKPKTPSSPHGVEGELTDRSREVLRDVRIVVVDDVALHRATLAAAFALHVGAELVGAWDVASLRLACQSIRPHIVLLNISTRDSMVLLRTAIEIDPRVKVIVLGVSDDDASQLAACVEAGVAGYHTRRETLAELLNRISRVAAGETSFSPALTKTVLRRLAYFASEYRPRRRN
jgi:CheY-like chemotaxis protein